MSNGFVYIAASNGAQFANAASNDFMFYTQSNSQKLLLGVGGGNALGQANITVSSNLTSFSGDIAITNAISIKGLTIMQSDGTTANVTAVNGVNGLSNDNAGMVLAMASNTSNYSFRFTSTSNLLMSVRGDGLLDVNSVQVRSNLVAPAQSNQVWDMSGTCSTWSGGEQAGPVAASNIASNVVVSTNTPFSNLTTEGSIVLPGTAGGFISVSGMGTPAAPSNVPLPDFTVEGWVYLPSAPTSAIPNLIGQMSPLNGLNYWSFGVDNTNKLCFYLSNGANCTATGGTVSNLAWAHIAACYTSNSRTLQMYLNGALQTLTVSGTNVSGSGTTTATYTAPMTGGTNLIVGQYNNVPLAASVSCLRLCQGFTYTSSFTPQPTPLTVLGSNQTRLLLRAPLNAAAAASCTIDSSRGLRARCLPSDAFVYADCYSATSASINNYSNAPTFDSNVSQAILFNRAANNSLVMSPQSINTITRGFSFLMKTRFTSNIQAWEDVFIVSGSNALIYMQRVGGTSQFGFGLRTNGVSGDVYLTTPTNILQNQVYVLAGRYDPYVAGGTSTLYVNGSNVGSSNANSANIRDAVFTNLAIGGNSFNGEVHCCAFYNRALSDREIADATAVLLDRPNSANSLEVGSMVTGKPSLVVREDGSVQVAGPIVGANGQAWAAVDVGASNLSLQGYCVGTVSANGMSPYAARAGDGSLYFNGSAGNYVAFPSGVANPYVGGVQDTTFEAWVYITQAANINMVVGRASSPSSGVNDWGIYVNNATLVGYVYGANGTQYIASHHVPLATNTWNHVAMTVASGAVRVFLNGLLGTTSATIVGNARYNAAYNTYVGCFNNTANNMFYGYMANMRILSGLAAYTANFAPPTAPVGAAASTLLCMRVQQGPGRVLVPRIGGTAVAQAFPPAGMTANATNILSAPYGNGMYIASASTELDSGSLACNAFSKLNTNWWNTAASYNSSGVYTGSYVTADVAGAQYSGEWIQLQMPSAIVLSSLTVYNYTGDINYMCKSFVLLGSSDGVRWTALLQVSGISSIAPVSYSVSTQQAFTAFRIVATSIYGNATRIVFEELIFYGTKEAITTAPDGQVGVGVSQPRQALEVAGNAVFGGNISAGNMGMFRNRIINGDMRIAQRGTSLLVPAASGPSYYIVDRFYVYTSAANSITISQVGLGTNETPYSLGFQYSYRVQTTTVVAGTLAFMGQHIEGYNMADFLWGTSCAKPITISMWIKSNAASGTLMSIGIKSGIAHCYGAQYTYNVSGAWQFVTVTIPPPPSTITWGPGSAGAINLVLFSSWAVSGGAPYTWAALNGYNYNGESITFFQTLNNYVQFTGVQVEAGTMATPFEFRPYPIELQLCQRYYEKSFAVNIAPAAGISAGYIVYNFGPCIGGTQWVSIIPFKVTKRDGSSITMTYYNPYQASTGNWRLVNGTGSDNPTITTAYITYINPNCVSVFSTSQYSAHGHWSADNEL